MKTIQYLIDNTPITVNMEGSPDFQCGQPEVLSNSVTDITHGQPWYPQGYHIADFLPHDEFNALRTGLSSSISAILSNLGLATTGFELENYHKVIDHDDQHYQVVSQTRDLFSKNFKFPIERLMPALEQLLGFGLTDVDPATQEKMHIIVRINRPRSTDFNPPHKDMYSLWDEEGKIWRFMNFWIPIAGVTKLSSLPLVPGSHLLPEDKVLRTFEGAIVEGNKYRVNAIVEWNGSHELVRPEIHDGQVLMFSSHLIHGLAKNEQPDTTRVALEFRLFRKE